MKNRPRKKMESHKAKRKEQKRAVARFQSAGIPARMVVAQDWPVMDTRVSNSLWDNGQCLTEFTFGKDGKPFFIGGPNDSPARVQQIIKTLARTAGPDKFHYLTPVDVRDLPPELVEIVESGNELGI